MTAAVSSGRRRTDLLEAEHQHGRISAEAFAAGRAIEDVLERLQAAGGQQWDVRVDQSRQPDTAAIRSVEVARQAAATMQKVAAAVGPVDTRLLRRVLGDGMSFDQVAAAEGKTGDRAVAYFATRIRDGLEELGRKFIATGRPSTRAVDKFSAEAKRRKIG